MSYTPIIMFDFSSAKVKEQKLEDLVWGNDETISNAAKTILDATRGGFIELGDKKFVTIQPEIASDNNDVRNLLTSLGIEFAVDN